MPELDGPVPATAQEQVLVPLVPENLVNWTLGEEREREREWKDKLTH